MNRLCRCDTDAVARVVIAAVLASLLMLAHLPALAQTESHSQKYEFDIPRTSRVMALHALSTQAGGLLLGYISSDTTEEQALVGPIKGRHTIDDALRVIVSSSTLTFRWIEANMVSVEPLSMGDVVANADIPGMAKPRSTDVDPVWPYPREEVTVTSWPVRDLTLAVAPVTVMDRDRIDAIGAPTLAEALRYISQSAYTRPEGYRTSGAQYAEMRGLGPDTALVLINGRRALPSANSITSSAFDLNTVPITAVERVEFLLDSAAAPYGTDAIGGVINIVLRETVPEPTVEVRYGEASGGAEQHRFTFSGGLNRDRYHGAVVLDYFELDGLLGADRELWRDQDFSRFGGVDRRTQISSPGNIASFSLSNLPGLPSTFASVPLQDATPGVSREDFIATAGTRNLDSLLKYSTVVPEATRISATATGSVELTERITASAELLYVDRDATYYFSPPALPGMPVMPSNAFNPFGTVVLTYRLLPELDSQYQYVESDLLRTVGAIHGGWGDWDWEVAAVRSKEDAATWSGNVLDLLGAVTTALASPNPNLALNPFQSGPVGSPELLDSLRATRDVDEFASEGTQFSAYVQGPLARLWAGPVTTVIGGEWRNEGALFNGPMGSFDRDRDVTAGFAQLHVPLVSASMRWPGVHELLLTAGSRLDQYSDSGRVTRSQLGVLWKPHHSLAVRASSGRSFRPPSLYELYLPDISTFGRASDPARNNELASISVTVGGNGDLRPSTAKSFTGGIVFSPDSAMNWKISADYWRVTMDERVGSIPLPLLLANEARFLDRIERADRTDADIQAGLPGALRSVDMSRINAGRVSASGVDLAIRSDFLTNAGRFTPEVLATWFDKYLATDIPGRPALDRVNVASELGSILEWRAIFSLSWKRGPFGATAFARYTPSYDDASGGVRSGREVASQTLFDLHASVDVGKMAGRSRLWDGFRVTVGANNLFDEEPSYANVGDAAGFDLSQGDLKQRSYYLRLDKKF